MKWIKDKLLLLLAVVVLFLGGYKVGSNTHAEKNPIETSAPQIVQNDTSGEVQIIDSDPESSPVTIIHTEQQNETSNSPEQSNVSNQNSGIGDSENAELPDESEFTVYEDQEYETKDEVAMYLYLYGHLPSNYMTKSEARDYGWESGALHLVVEGMSIGGDRFGNNEGLLPHKKGRKYYECDIDTLHSKSRGPKRIVYSSDGLIYYTDDHYDTFELLYGDE